MDEEKKSYGEMIHHENMGQEKVGEETFKEAELAENDDVPDMIVRTGRRFSSPATAIYVELLHERYKPDEFPDLFPELEQRKALMREAQDIAASRDPKYAAELAERRREEEMGSAHEEKSTLNEN